MKKTLIIVGCILAVVTGAVLTLFSGNNQYTKTADKFMSYMNKGDFESSYSLFSSRKKGTVKADEWKKYVEEVSTKFPPSCERTDQLQISDTEKTYTNDNKAARYACDFILDGGNYRILFVFITEGSEIVIDEMQGYALL